MILAAPTPARTDGVDGVDSRVRAIRYILVEDLFCIHRGVSTLKCLKVQFLNSLIPACSISKPISIVYIFIFFLEMLPWSITFHRVIFHCS